MFMAHKVSYEGSKIEKNISQVTRFLKYLWLIIFLQGFIVTRLFITGCYDNVLHMAGCRLNGTDVSFYVNWSLWVPIIGFVVVWPFMSIVVHFIGCAIHHAKQNT